MGRSLATEDYERVLLIKDHSSQTIYKTENLTTRPAQIPRSNTPSTSARNEQEMAADGPLTHGHKGAVKSRNFALMSMFGVFAGAWLVFRVLAPKRGSYVVSDEERATMRGGLGDKFPEGNRTATVPKSVERT
ncbi:uncharacterized protein CDV56_105315 [Aspergillus thermomutatus]|uniref:Transmembrane protein n=1 Tax=Aspergillus thermomutatus TaxID=41047 RepID=A0A397GFB0_ASPTH|nr:uncharacterized protein CDV56_105315 [Aspergillus thermomutatus]RHZ48338.1 hypothetical protein CDV56_105315 [Aspergillus thermomutatus]